MYFFIVLAALVAIILFISYLAYLKAFHNSRKKKKDRSILPDSEQYRKIKSISDELSAEMDTIPYEEIHITARDGTKLAARYYHVNDGAPLHIQCHGYRGSAVRDFCGGNKMAREFGHNTLVVDQRAHGKSGGHTISFGIKERFDCIDWVNYAIDRFGDDIRIFISGVSMGASTVIMAAGEKLPHNVVGVLADCPYSSPKEIISRVCAKIGLPPRLAYPFAALGALVFGGFRIWETDCIRAASKSKIPILIAHGEADDFVPHSMSERIRDAAPDKVSLELFPDAGHGLSFIVDPEKYIRTVGDFMRSIK